MKKRKAPAPRSVPSLVDDDETLQAMLRQEALYDCMRTSTFTHHGHANSDDHDSDDDENHRNRGLQVVTPEPDDALFSRCVQSMMEIFQLCQLKHLETVVYAAMYLHRCLPHTTSTSTSTSLWALVCFYVAIKIHEPAALPLKTLPDLYQRFFCSGTDSQKKKKQKKKQQVVFSLEDFKACELLVYQTLDWKLYPPTAMDFVRQLRNGYGYCLCPRSATLLLLERAFQQDPQAFVQDHRPSTLAMAALCLLQGTTTTDSNISSDIMDTLTDVVVEQQGQVLNHHHHPPKDSSTSWRELGQAMGFLARIQQLQLLQGEEVNGGRSSSTTSITTGKNAAATKYNRKKRRRRSSSTTSSISNNSPSSPDEEEPRQQQRKKIKTSTSSHNEDIICQRSPRSALLMTSSVSSESLLSAAETSSY